MSQSASQQGVFPEMFAYRFCLFVCLLADAVPSGMSAGNLISDPTFLGNPTTWVVAQTFPQGHLHSPKIHIKVDPVGGRRTTVT